MHSIKDLFDYVGLVLAILFSSVPFFLWGIYRQSVRQTKAIEKAIEDMALNRYFEKRAGK